MGSIYKGDKILGTTIADKLVTTTAITVAGLPEDSPFANIANGKTYEAGTDIATILKDLLSKEINPGVATRPSITTKAASNANLGIKEVYSSVVIPAISTTTNVGRFNSAWSGEPKQPAVEGVTFSNITITPSSQVGFNEYEPVAGESISQGSAKVALGSNMVRFTATGNYTAPTNKPITNLSNEYSGSDATFTEGTATHYINVTSTGVYPIFTNISGTTYTDGVNTKVGLQTSATFTFAKAPSEVAAGKHFMIDYPATKTVSAFKVKDLTGAFVNYAGSYNAEVSTENKDINGTMVPYKRFAITGAFQGEGDYQIVFNSTMDK